MEKKDWLKYFPYKEPRDQQEKVLNKVLEDFNNGKKYAVIECGTGVGKSAIGITVSRYLNDSFKEDPEVGSYFLTTQKILQEQYERDFKKIGMKSLYSSSNYTCKRQKGTSCKDVQDLIRQGAEKSNQEKCSYDCIYKQKKTEFCDSNLAVTNFSYFLTEKNYNGKTPRKKVLVVDEAHNLEGELSRFIEISVSQHFAKNVLKIRMPELNTQFQAFNWVRDVYLPELMVISNNLSNKLRNMGITSQKLAELKSLHQKVQLIKNHLTKIEQFIELYEKDNWIFELSKTEKKGFNKLVFKPIEVSKYAHEYLLNHADFIIFMSATIISHHGFCELIGLDEDKVSFVKEETPFDPNKRPIVYMNTGKMSASVIDKTLPKMTRVIKEIIETHKGQKGIIHTHNKKIAEYIRATVRSKRLKVAYGSNREKMLEEHCRSKNDTILVSPSMSEGVDLKGDLSKFQIICKMPFPYLGDKVCRKKMNKWKWWYDTQTIRTIVQSVGRSIRNEEDEAITYILDSDWERIMNKCGHMFPSDFFKSYCEY